MVRKSSDIYVNGVWGTDVSRVGGSETLGTLHQQGKRTCAIYDVRV